MFGLGLQKNPVSADALFGRATAACVSSPRDWAVSVGSHMQQYNGISKVFTRFAKICSQQFTTDTNIAVVRCTESVYSTRFFNATPGTVGDHYLEPHTHLEV